MSRTPPGPATREGPDVLDPVMLDELRTLEASSGTPLIADLTATFQADVRARIAEMRGAAGSGDVGGVKTVAHRLRGSAAALGATRAAALATEIEATAPGLTRELLLAAVDRMAEECDRAVDALERVARKR